MKGLRSDLQLEEEILFGLRPAAPSPLASSKSTRAAALCAPGLNGLRQQSLAEPDKQFDALMHYVDVDLLKAAHRWLGAENVTGADARVWHSFGENLQTNAIALYTRLHRGEHRTLSPWRRALALAQGKPLKRDTLKDRIVQRALAAVLDCVFECHLTQSDCGFVRVRSKEEAVAALSAGDQSDKVRWVVTAHVERLRYCLRFAAVLGAVKRRVADERVLDLIGRWLKGGLLEETNVVDGIAVEPNGALPALLMDVFFRHHFDLWAQRWRDHHARSAVLMARDESHLFAVFQHKPAARRFQVDLRNHISQCAPSLRPLDVRLIGHEHSSAAGLDEGNRATVMMTKAGH